MEESKRVKTNSYMNNWCTLPIHQLAVSGEEGAGAQQVSSSPSLEEGSGSP